MWTRSLRPLRPSIHRKARFSRGYSGQPRQGPHTTYFQQPSEPPRPKRKTWPYVLVGTTSFVAGFLVPDLFFDDLIIEENSMNAGQSWAEFTADMLDQFARFVPPISLDTARSMLEMGAGITIMESVATHNVELASNSPCEDTTSSGAFGHPDDTKHWLFWTIFDGHAGPTTANVLAKQLVPLTGTDLVESGCLDRNYIPNDSTIFATIKASFQKMDTAIIQNALERIASDDGNLALSIGMAAPAMAGSCALVAFFDPDQSVLRVANVGDSRAVLGTWDESKGGYVARAMSEDQTGFNSNEVERLRQEHPGEDPVDPKTGRVHGLAVTRAFGDARWKWPQGLSRKACETIWGPNPRPDGMIKTPPYLTAEPVIMETRVQTGDHPDFLIMASDGLWDNISSDDAVLCVQQWLDKNSPGEIRKTPLHIPAPVDPHNFLPTADPDEDSDTYWDETEKALKWRVSPKHFIVEDDHCAIHLVKNALGGRRRNLFRGIMTIRPPHSRNVRDDISVQVIFFGVDKETSIGHS